MVVLSMDLDSATSSYLVAPLSQLVPPREHKASLFKAIERTSGYGQLFDSELVRAEKSSHSLHLNLLISAPLGAKPSTRASTRASPSKVDKTDINRTTD
jgi:hypothetical protein